MAKPVPRSARQAGAGRSIEFLFDTVDNVADNVPRLLACLLRQTGQRAWRAYDNYYWNTHSPREAFIFRRFLGEKMGGVFRLARPAFPKPPEPLI